MIEHYKTIGAAWLRRISKIDKQLAYELSLDLAAASPETYYWVLRHVRREMVALGLLDPRPDLDNNSSPYFHSRTKGKKP